MRKGLFITGIGFIIIIGFVWYFVGSQTMITPPQTLITPPTEPNPPSFIAEPAFISEKVIVDNVGSNSLVTSGMEITGKAKLYYFEASFPVTLVDANGRVVLQTHAEAQSDWMTSEFVPFKVVNFQFARPATSTGKLILAKDNPSGLPEHDESVEIPVRFY